MKVVLMPEAIIIPFPSRPTLDDRAISDGPVDTWDFSVDAFLPEDSDPESRDEVEYRSQRLNGLLAHLAIDLTFEQISSLQQFIADLTHAVSEASYHEGIIEATSPDFSEF
jgi:hypothetical protein